MQITNSLSLRIVDINHIVPHEHHDKNRSDRIYKQIQKDKILRNPPIVAQYHRQYVLLDGATRVSALHALKCPHIVVQEIDQDIDQLSLSTWNHVLQGIEKEELLSMIKITPNIVLETNFDITNRFKIDQALCSVTTSEKTFHVVDTSNNNDSQVLTLSNFVNNYSKKTNVLRTKESDIKSLQKDITSSITLIQFPKFAAKFVLESATNNNLLPAGVTKFSINKRVLGVNMPLDLLCSNQSLTDKNAWLNNLITNKIQLNKVRQYTEPVIIIED
ncbi:MAG TPA: hypothetical protein DCL76_07215 [Chloroflexi bacterium]|nr:hypothetical protein [Chloroflexota bacterium]